MGGGGSPKNTTQTQELPAWARGYAKDVLAKGAALTDINQNPYVAYGGERLAGFDPMQQQSYADAQNMSVAPQIGQATQMATQAAQYNPADFQNQYNNRLQQYTGANVNQYMNPYLEGALAPQLREAASAGMQAQNLNAAKAVGQGAFGGTRGALQQSLTEKNTLQNMADINAKGYSDAFNQAAGMFGLDQQRQMQDAQLRAQYGLSSDQAREQSRQFGAGQGLNAAQLLGQLGGQQFQQGMDINKLRNTYGAQQQSQAQRANDLAYQNFMDQQNYAYKQLGFMSDLIKNPAIGSRNQTQMYEAPTSPLNTLAGLGLTAAGAGSANGGLMGYAGGGIAGYADGGMTGDISEILSKLSDEQLQQAMQTHPEMAQEIQMEMARREDIRGAASMPPMEQGLGSAPAGPMPQMAGGGIVAFANGSLVDLEEAKKKLAAATQSGDMAAINQYVQMVNDLQKQVGAQEPPLPAPIERSEGIAYGGDRVLPALAGIPTDIGNKFNKFSKESQAVATKRRQAIADLFDPVKNPRRTTRVVDPAAPTSEPKAGLPAAAAAVDQSKLKGAPQPAPDNRQAAPDGGPSSVSASSSSRGLGYAKMDMPDLGYTAKTPEEIETQIAAMSGRSMEKNKGILDAEAADVKEESDALLKAKGGDQKRLLFSMAAAAFGSKAQGLDLGGIMTAGLRTDADQRKLNTESEKALRESKKQMRRYEQAMKDGSEDKAGKLYGLAAAETEKARQAKIDQMELALKQQGLNISAEQLKVARDQANKPPAQVELINAAMRDPKFAAMYKDLMPDRSAANDSRIASDLSEIEPNFAKTSRGAMLLKDPVAFNAEVRRMKLEYLQTIKRPDLIANLGFVGGAGAGSTGPLVQQGT